MVNITPIHASVWDLPFDKSSFDCVVMNGVLEWVGEWFDDCSPREVQLKALERRRELLKPGGTLFVAIENRIGFEFLYRTVILTASSILRACCHAIWLPP